MKKYIFIVILLLALTSASPSQAREVTVLLMENAARCSIGGNALIIRDAGGRSTKPFSGSFQINYSKGAMTAGKYSYKLPAVITSSSPLACGGIKHHGSLVIEAGSRGLNVINRVNMEDYLKGVLKSEMSPGWPLEALKAQAVLARTYTLSSKKHGRYDVCSRVHCQLYEGTEGEARAIIEAVTATAGEILTYSGAPAQIFYFGDSGGMTTSAKSVWGKDIPYLAARADPLPSKGPNAAWQATVSMSQIESRLSAAGIRVGTISSLRPVRRDESGRVLQLEVKGSGGSQLIAGSKFRTALGTGVIKSTLFEFNSRSAYNPTVQPARETAAAPEAAVQPERSYPANIDASTMPESDEDKLVWMAKNKIFTTAELMAMIGKSKEYPRFVAEGEARMSGKKIPVSRTEPRPQSAAPQPAAASAPTATALSMEAANSRNVTIFGRGTGHGVGFPQWTAKSLAEAGWSYIKMLEYYFPGTTLKKEL
ncbi:MAG: SpoIID/LytB domain-containing protein [Synergistaceae bacterium]|nr:SpoIID/LytB domain-containing protein [Synergistaceae bacterium]